MHISNGFDIKLLNNMLKNMISFEIITTFIRLWLIKRKYFSKKIEPVRHGTISFIKRPIDETKTPHKKRGKV